jgi:hypothetical protein
MNERLLELARQAKIEFTYDPTETPMRAFAECWEDELAKFAELIVRECLDQCYNRGMNDALYEGQLKAAAYIEEHFGIEQ